MEALTKDRTLGALWACRFLAEQGRFACDEEQSACLEADEGFSWLHFPLSDQRARRFLERYEPLPAAARAALLGGERRLAIQGEGEWMFGVLPELEHDFHAAPSDIERLYFAMGPRVLLTARRHALQGVDRVKRAVEAGAAVHSPLDLLVMLIEQFIELNEQRQHEFAAAIESIEDRVLGGRGDPSRLQIGPTRFELSRQHREFLTLRSVLQRAMSHRGPARTHLEGEQTRSLIQQLDDFDRDAMDLLERARLLQEEIGERINATTNRNLRLLTILSTLMMPPTLIVGAFGMNVEGIPWSKDAAGFAEACLLCGAGVAVCYTLLRVFKVLK